MLLLARADTRPRTVQMYCQLFERSELPGKADGAGNGSTSQAVAKEASKSSSKGDAEAADAGGDGQADLVALAQSSVDGFFKLLNAKVGHSLSRREGPASSPSATTTPTSSASLRAKTDLFSGEMRAAGGGLENPAGGAAEGGELDPVALGGVVAAVQQLVSDMETVDPHVPQVTGSERPRFELVRSVRLEPTPHGTARHGTAVDARCRFL